MSLTNEDKQWIKGAITEGVVDALNEIVLPRFEEHDAKFEQIDRRFEQIDRRFDSVDLEFRKIHAEMAELRTWMEQIDNRVLGIESDIKEIYDRITALEKKAPNLSNKEQIELGHKFEAMLDWAKLVSEKTGVALPRF